MAPILALVLLSVIRLSAQAQPIPSDLWVTDGQVNAVVHDGATIYIAGAFSRVGPPTGGGVPISAASGALPPSFPRVEGVVSAVASDGAGGWYIGGSFESVGGLPRANLAHVRGDLSVSAWSPNANLQVNTLAVSGATVYVGGSFFSVGGEYRSHIAALDAATGAATSWDPGANAEVHTLAVSGATVYAGGLFTLVGGQLRSRIGALSAATGAATAWNPNADDAVYALAVSGGTVYACGSFTSVGGQARNRIAALDAASGAATAWDPNPDNIVHTIAASGATIYAGGWFTSIGGQSRNYIAALDAVTGAATAWNPASDDYITVLEASGSTIYASGLFNHIGGQARHRLAALDAATGSATSWDPDPNNSAGAMDVSGGTVYVGGGFTSFGGLPRSGLAALDAATGAATAWNPNPDAPVWAVVPQAGTVYVGGNFTAIGGQSRSYIAALDASTGTATAWNPGADGFVFSMVKSGGVIFAAGSFMTVGGQLRSNIAAVDAATGLATGFDPDADEFVRVLAVSGGTVYAGGDFSSIGGQSRNYLAALDATSGAATGWNPDPNSQIWALAASGGVVYAGGTFTTIGGLPRNYIAALDATSGVATAWNPGANAVSFALVPDGRIVYAGGGFTIMGGLERHELAAIDAVTGDVMAWDPRGTLPVYALALRGTTVYAGGIFSRMDGRARSGIVAIAAPPLVAGVAPASGGNSGVTTVTVFGQNLKPGATVGLVTAGPPPIPGGGVVVAADGRSLIASFDLSGAALGPRNVVVTNPDLQTATLINGFTIESLAAPQLRVDLIGPDRVRTGYPTAFDLVLQNPGNIDVRGVPLWIAGIPAGATVRLDFPLTPVPQAAGEPDWSQLPGDLTSPGGRYLALVIPRVPPGTMTRRLYLTLPSPTSFQLTAALTPPWTAAAPFRACLADGGVIADTPCLGAQLGAIDGYLLAHPEAQGMNGIGVWAKIGWQCEGAGSLAAALAEAQQALGFMLQPVELQGTLPPGCAAVLGPSWRQVLAIQVGGSIDPNDKFGNRGAGSAITSQQILSYSVRFENLGGALFPAQQVVVSDALDSDLDLNTLSLGTIAFGKDPNGTPYHLFPPPGQSSYAASLDLRPARNLIVNVSVLFTGSTLNWYFTSVDPAGQPLPPDAGFLPPNLNPPEGEGSVVFTVRPRNGLAPGTQITNAASLTFDNNPPMTTPLWANSVDDSPPASHVLPLGSPHGAPSVPVSWSADGAPGDLRDFTVCVSEDGGPYRAWRLNTTATTDTFMVRSDDHRPHTYAFYSVARDQIGNSEAPPLNPDAQTTSVLAVDPSAPSRLTLAGAGPNPARGAFHVWFTLPSGEAAVLDVLDLAGRRVMRREVGSLGPGSHAVILDPSPRLTSGLYFLRLAQGERTLRARIVLIR